MRKEKILEYLGDKKSIGVVMRNRIIGSKEYDTTSSFNVISYDDKNDELTRWGFWVNKEQEAWNRNFIEEDFDDVVENLFECMLQYNTQKEFDLVIGFLNKKMFRGSIKELPPCIFRDNSNEVYKERPALLVENMPDYNGKEELKPYFFWRRIGSRCEGQTREEIAEYIRNNPNEFHVKHAEVCTWIDPVFRVEKPGISRASDNSNKKTFDFITIELIVKIQDDLKEFVKENLPHLKERAIERIAEDKGYQKYNVPVGFLKLYSIGTRGNGVVVLNFQLKDI